MQMFTRSTMGSSVLFPWSSRLVQAVDIALGKQDLPPQICVQDGTLILSGCAFPRVNMLAAAFLRKIIY